MIRINEIDEKVKIIIHLRTWCGVYHDNKSIIMTYHIKKTLNCMKNHASKKIKIKK